MAKSNSRKAREREAKARGIDVHALKRGSVIPAGRKTKTLQESLRTQFTKYKNRNFTSQRDDDSGFCI